ncbi:hypothetical protein N431DRAFT_125033 [Stipitochalara longipes BDJ]|nr:hypothetical protein N431DRAFT_125033 [Stipitochalara longipes BDJ]
MKGEKEQRRPNAARWHLAWPRSSKARKLEAHFHFTGVWRTWDQGRVSRGAWVWAWLVPGLQRARWCKTASGASGAVVQWCAHSQKRARSGLGTLPAGRRPHPGSPSLLEIWISGSRRRLDQRSPRGPWLELASAERA